MMTVEELCAVYGSEHEPWLTALLAAVEMANQSRIARQLGVSPAMVNLLVHGNYTKDLALPERQVRRLLMGPLECPVMGTIADEDCRGNQALPYSNANHIRVAIFKACRSGCRHSLIPARAK